MLSLEMGGAKVYVPCMMSLAQMDFGFQYRPPSLEKVSDGTKAVPLSLGRVEGSGFRV